MVFIPNAYVHADAVFVHMENFNQHLKWEIAASPIPKKLWKGESKNLSHNA